MQNNMYANKKKVNNVQTTTPNQVAQAYSGLSTNDIINNNVNGGKNQANQVRWQQNAVNNLGADYATQYSNLYNNPSLYNTKVSTLTQEYADLDDQMNNLLKSKYGADYDVSQGWNDPYDTKGYNEYMRLAMLKNQAEKGLSDLEANEQSRISQISNQDSQRLAQQKYMDEYAKMQGMAYSGYGDNLQAQTYNDYINAINQINQNAYANQNDIVSQYKDAALQSQANNFNTALENAALDVENYNGLLSSVSSLEELDSLNERYSDVLDGAKKSDRNLEYNINSKGADLVVNAALKENVDENGEVVGYTPTLSLEEWNELKTKYKDYVDAIPKETMDYLDELYGTLDSLLNSFKLVKEAGKKSYASRTSQNNSTTKTTNNNMVNATNSFKKSKTSKNNLTTKTNNNDMINTKNSLKKKRS